MTAVPEWWYQPRRITVMVDNPSWIIPFAEQLVTELRQNGDDAAFAREHEDIREGAVAFYLGCVYVTPSQILARNRRNLVVHESDLPKGRGFSPLTWQILEGRGRIPVCLLEAINEVDSGPVIYRDALECEGHELIGELREKLGDMTVSLCRRFLAETIPPAGMPQLGERSFYSRRRPSDSRLDPARTIAEQFDLLRVVDNERYPAWFEHRGCRYRIKIEKMTD
ncbi:MAG TPA: UDP-glucuronic acid dehydrogenase [Pseudolabrys sp.]